MSEKVNKWLGEIMKRHVEATTGGCRILSLGDGCDCTLCLCDAVRKEFKAEQDRSIAAKYDELYKLNPWKYDEDGGPATLLMGREEGEDARYAVLVMRSWWDGGWPDEWKPGREFSFAFFGATMEEALDKALAAAKAETAR